MQLFDSLHESQETQRSLCRQLVRTSGGTARELVFLQLKVELEAHAAAEERYLYVPIMMADAGLHASRHALHEHHEIEELCEDLSVRRKDGAAWMNTARALSKQVHHHLHEEEKKFFKVAGRILSTTRKATLARQYLRDLVRMRRKYADDYQRVAVSAAGDVKPARRG